MTTLIYEILALANFVVASIYHFYLHDHETALYCMLVAIFMAVMSIKYDRGTNE